MKEDKLIQMLNKVNKLDEITQQIIREMYNLKNLAVGTLETIRRMPDYDEALEKLKQESEKQKKEVIKNQKENE